MRKIPRKPAVKLAVVDNSIDPEIYVPCDHWKEFVPVPFDSYRAKAGQLPSLKDDALTHIILTGSEASILERERWVEDEADFVREAHAKGRCLLGSCWGHQLLAFALAGPSCVGRCREPEIGWIEVRMPSKSRLLGPSGSAWTFSFHFDEVVRLGSSFRILASTSACSVQAFEMVGRPVWGLQIHPEISIVRGRETLARFLERDPSQGAIIQAALRAEPRDSGLIRRIVDAFLAAEPQE